MAQRHVSQHAIQTGGGERAQQCDSGQEKAAVTRQPEFGA